MTSQTATRKKPGFGFGNFKSEALETSNRFLLRLLRCRPPRQHQKLERATPLIVSEMRVRTSSAAYQALWEGDVVDRIRSELIPSLRGNLSQWPHAWEDPERIGDAARIEADKEKENGRFAWFWSRRCEAVVWEDSISTTRLSPTSSAPTDEDDDKTVRTTRRNIDGRGLLTRQDAMVLDRPSFASIPYQQNQRVASVETPVLSRNPSKQLTRRISSLTTRDKEERPPEAWGDPLHPPFCVSSRLLGK